jgi:hypothetical protein
MSPVTNQQATQVAPAYRPGPPPGTRPVPAPVPAAAPPTAQQPTGRVAQPDVPAQPPTPPAPRRDDRDRPAPRDDERRGGGLGVVAALLGWVPRILLALAVYQLVRLVPGFDVMPSAAGLPLFAALGDIAVSLLNLDPVWAPRMAELSIPLLGIVTSAVVNLFRAVRMRRGGRTWPFWLVVVVWVIVIAVQGVVGYAQQVTQDARDSLQEQREQLQDDLEQGVQDTTEDVRDSLWESLEDALPWS